VLVSLEGAVYCEACPEFCWNGSLALDSKCSRFSNIIPVSTKIFSGLVSRWSREALKAFGSVSNCGSLHYHADNRESFAAFLQIHIVVELGWWVDWCSVPDCVGLTCPWN